MNTGQAPPTPHPILWIIGLVTAISAAILATLMDSYVKGEDDRNHHGVQIFNECVEEQFGAYIIFFFAFATSTSFSKYWGTGLLALSLILAIIFYVRGIRSTTRHQLLIRRDHTCKNNCMEGLKTKTALKIFGLNLLFAVLLFAVSCYLAAISVSSPTQ